MGNQQVIAPGQPIAPASAAGAWHVIVKILVRTAPSCESVDDHCEPSESRLYFSNIQGNVLQLPQAMSGEHAKPLPQ